MGRGNANADSVALASRSGLRCLIENERDLLSLQEVLAQRPEQYLHEGAVESSVLLPELAATCAHSFLASESATGSAPFSPEEKEQVGQMLYAVALLEGEPHGELIAAIDAELAKARRHFVPDDEELEDLVLEYLLEDGLDEQEFERALSDHDESYLDARERAIEDLCDRELAPAVEFSQYVYDLWHALPVDPNVLREPLPTPGEARTLRQEADRARAELPQAA